MKNSVTKRFRITRTGKIMRRSMAIDHFRTRKSTKNLRRKRKSIGADIHKKQILNYAKS